MDKFHLEILTGSLGWTVGVQQGYGGENKLFSSIMPQYLEHGMKYVQNSQNY